MTVTLKTKTEITVPRSIRLKAGIKPGEQVEFSVSGRTTNITPKLSGDEIQDEREIRDPKVRGAIRDGASLRGWRELFPNALVYGADIDRDILFEEERIKTFYCDQLDQGAIQDLWSQPVLEGGVDVIIDDGLHTFEGNTSFLDGSLSHLRPGGIYVIEDILQTTIERWRNALKTIYSKSHPRDEFAFVQVRNSLNHYDNNLLIIRKDA
jgi:bifunctional DNA-binding transcriptional regulator/antitoxin component of YhaV-PrlF toxin-antitoxin module